VSQPRKVPTTAALKARLLAICSDRSRSTAFDFHSTGSVALYRARNASAYGGCGRVASSCGCYAHEADPAARDQPYRFHMHRRLTSHFSLLTYLPYIALSNSNSKCQ
jgi:hypothetical protein